MDFQFDDTDVDQFLHDVYLIEKTTQRVFNDKLRFIYLEMPKFRKSEEELFTRFDKWMYVIKTWVGSTEYQSSFRNVCSKNYSLLLSWPLTTGTNKWPIRIA